MAFLFTKRDLSRVYFVPPGGVYVVDGEIVDVVEQTHRIGSEEDGFLRIALRPENLFKLVNCLTQLVYLLVFHLTDMFPYKSSTFFGLTAAFSCEILVRSGYFQFEQVWSLHTSSVAQYGLLLRVGMWADVFGDFFRHPMVFLMAWNRLEAVKCAMSFRADKGFPRSRIIILVSLCVMIAAIAAVVLIQTSDMRRLYIRSIGFVDSGVPGYQMLINRLFYIFPAGSIVCYVVLYFHIRRMSHQVLSRRTAQSGEQRVFIQLFITILFYGAMCIIFEYLNLRDWGQDPVSKVDLVAVLNIVNYLPEISLPLMLLLSNTDMRRRISTMMQPPRGVLKSATVSVVQVQ